MPKRWSSRSSAIHIDGKRMTRIPETIQRGHGNARFRGRRHACCETLSARCLLLTAKVSLAARRDDVSNRTTAHPRKAKHATGSLTTRVPSTSRTASTPSHSPTHRGNKHACHGYTGMAAHFRTATVRESGRATRRLRDDLMRRVIMQWVMKCQKTVQSFRRAALRRLKWTSTIVMSSSRETGLRRTSS